MRDSINKQRVSMGVSPIPQITDRDKHKKALMTLEKARGALAFAKSLDDADTEGCYNIANQALLATLTRILEEA